MGHNPAALPGRFSADRAAKLPSSRTSSAEDSGDMSGVRGASSHTQDRGPKLPADFPGYPHGYSQDGTEPTARQTCTHLGNGAGVECKKVASKKQLQSLIGTLSHAATVVVPGRTFLRRMIDTMRIPKRQHHHVRLNREFQSDIHWWACFLPLWNGKTILPPQQVSHAFWSDASGSWGCGALSHTLHWFQVQWPESWRQCHIAAKEMVPVVIAVAVWGRPWSSSAVQVFSDNMAVVCAISSGSARDPLLMHFLPCLHFFCAHFQIILRAQHIAGVLNTAADALSRDKRNVFLSCFPQAPTEPSQVPWSLLNMLLHNQPDWTSSSWRTLFLSTLQDH